MVSARCFGMFISTSQQPAECPSSFLLHHTGWLCQIKLTNPSDFETLLTAEAYKKICEN